MRWLPLALTLAAATASAQKGPWWVDVDPGGGRLLVELPEAGEVALRIAATPPGEGATEAQVFSSRAAAGPDGGWLHEVEVRGLRADTLYEGRVTGPGFDRPVRLHTAPAADTPVEGRLAFLVYGDNRTGHEVHRALVARMAGEPEVRFLVHTGDFVEVGGRPADWQRYFDLAAPLLAKAPIYPTLGNHELYGPGGQRRYQRYFAPGSRVAWRAWTHGPVRFLSLDSNDDLEADGPQLRWLRAQLDASRDDPSVRFLIVFAHQGPLSSGRHGDHPRMAALGLARELSAAGVDLVLAGHDHMYERGEAEGLKYVITGGGGAPLYDTNRHRPGQQSFQVRHHYLRMAVEGERLTLEAVGLDGEVFERCGFVRGGPWECDVRASVEPGAPPEERRLAYLGLSVLLALLVGFYAWRRVRPSS